MRQLILITTAVSILFLSACTMHHPQTAEEFRQAVPGAAFAKIETFEADRPFGDVAKSFRKYGPKCLDVTIETTSRTNMSYQHIVTKYNPTVIVNKDRAELHLQQHHEKGVMNVTKEPEGGYYLLVADATPMGKKKTRISLFRPSMGFKALIKAVKGWATGENMGCPDMTKN